MRDNRLPRVRDQISRTALRILLNARSRARATMIFEAVADVQKLGNLPVPKKIPVTRLTKLMKELDYHKATSFMILSRISPNQLKKKKY